MEVPASAERGRVECDEVVVGGGAAGLTAALLLSQLGLRVLLVEKAAQLGGSLARFRLQGLEFDTGFHFSAGLQPGGMLSDMLRALGLDERVRMLSLDPVRGQLICVESTGRTFELPIGLERLLPHLIACFPHEQEGLRSFFGQMDSVCARTRMMDLRRMGAGTPGLAEDFVSLRDILQQQVADPELRALLSIFCMCHGAGPAEVSFANHSRVSIPLYDSVARVQGGGRALLEAFRGALVQQSVQVRCGQTIARFGPVQNRCCQELTLSSGETVGFSNLIFTIHPAAVLDALPAESVRPAFRDRVAAFTPSIGFFAVFARLTRAPGDPDWCRSILSILPDSDVDRLMAPDWEGDGAMLVMGGDPSARRADGEALHILETTPVKQVAAWAGSQRGRRPADYEEYKKRRCERLLQRLDRWHPGVAQRVEVLATASALTHREYLHSPDGSAYGIRQKVGQFNVIGHLPVRNFLAAGQSAILPGVLGTMMTSFVICRALVGVDQFDAWLQQRLRT